MQKGACRNDAEKEPKNLAQKPLLKALKRLNFITSPWVFDDFRKTSWF